MLGIAVHYSVTAMPTDHARCLAVRDGIVAYHTAQGYRQGIAYNALVCGHGEVVAGRGFGTTSGANGTTWANLNYWAVCGMCGPADTPTDAMLTTIARLCDEAPGPRDVRPHSDFTSTSCPGDALRAWVAAGARSPVPAAPILEEDDVPFHFYVTEATGDVWYVSNGVDVAYMLAPDEGQLLYDMGAVEKHGAAWVKHVPWAYMQKVLDRTAAKSGVPVDVDALAGAVVAALPPIKNATAAEVADLLADRLRA